MLRCCGCHAPTSFTKGEVLGLLKQCMCSLSQISQVSRKASWQIVLG